MNLLDAITSQAWMLHHPVAQRLVTLAESRLGLAEPMPARSVEDLARAKHARIAARASDWRGLLPGSSAFVENVDPSKVAGGGPGYFLVRSGGVNVAVIPVEGVLARHSNMVNGDSQEAGMSYGQLVSTVRAAVNDPQAGAVVLDIQSPGGSAHGADEAAAAIREMSAIKPIIAFAHQMAASAAYYIAQGASMIAVAPDGSVGSIGTLVVTYDSSGRAAQQGFRTIVVSSGEMKGAGWPGTPVGNEVVAEYQKVVDDLAARFFGVVQSARKMTDAELNAVNDGRMFLAKESVQLKLADAVLTASQVIDRAAQMARVKPAGNVARQPVGHNPASKKEKAMQNWDDVTESDIGAMPAAVVAKVAKAHKLTMAEQPASIADLRAAFAGDPAFALDAAEKGLTLNAAKAAYSEKLREQLGTANARNAELSRENEQLRAAKGTAHGGAPLAPLGQEPVGGEPAPVGMAAVTARVREIMKAGSIDRATALHRLAIGSAEDKSLHKAWTAAGRPKLEA